ncbi:unnamed protein product [Jaminaea pallidilutea]
MGPRRLPEQANTRHAHSLWLRIWRRRSPLYLHLKLYAVAALVSAVVARPISGRTCDSGVSKHEAESNLVDTGQRALNRWTDRLRDLSKVKRLVTQSSADSVRFPERHWQATVRSGTQRSPEQDFLRARRDFIRPRLATAIGTNFGSIDSDAVPSIAIGGSGGGFRAMLGYAAFLDAADRAGIST